MDPTEAKAAIKSLGREGAFETIELLSTEELRKLYGTAFRMAPEILGGGHPTDRALNLIVYELQRRENDRSFSRMWFATWIAIGLAAVQVAIAIAEILSK